MKILKNNSAFTLIEVLLVVTLFVIILSSAVSLVGTKTAAEDIDAKAIQVIDFVARAHDYSVSGYEGDVWGIKILDNDATCEDNGDCIVLFKSRQYSTRDANYDRIMNFNTGVYIEEDQENEFYFAYLSGWLNMELSTTSTQSILLKSSYGGIKKIWITPAGLISNYICDDNMCNLDTESCLTCYQDCGLCSQGHLTIAGGVSSYAVFAVGDYAYSANFSNGYSILAAVDSSNLELVTTTDTNGYAQDLGVVGDIIYIADSSGGLKVVDILDKNNPITTSTLVTTGDDFGVTINEDEDVLFVASTLYGCSGWCNDYYIYSYDISNPATPIELDSISVSGYGEMVVKGDYLYYGWGQDGGAALSWYDISNPTNMTHINDVNLYNPFSDENVEAVAVVDSYVYVGMRTYGIKIVSTSTASLEAIYDTPGSVYGLAYAGDTLFVADNNTSVLSLNLSNTPSLTLNTTYTVPYVAKDVYYSDNWLYVSDSDGVTSIHVP